MGYMIEIQMTKKIEVVFVSSWLDLRVFRMSIKNQTKAYIPKNI